jgi:hypothetical protein
MALCFIRASFLSNAKAQRRQGRKECIYVALIRVISTGSRELLMKLKS